MKTIWINASRHYPVHIGGKISSQVGALLKETLPQAQKVFVLTEETVAKLYLSPVVNCLEQAGFAVESYIVLAGENSKSGIQYLAGLEQLANAKISRTDCILALGGGVIGDLAGFLAATFLRGIAFVQVPTTLLAMVDSSVGGKVAINLAAGKNLAGTFYQPHFVLCDTDMLNSLPAAIFADGLAEVIKYAALNSPDLLQILEQEDMSAKMDEVIAICIDEKRILVEADESDKGQRQLLNFGHTVGHAIEKLENYTVSHGRAVAQGMIMETRAAVNMGLCAETCFTRLVKLLEKYHLSAEKTYDAEKLYQAALGDKKRAGDKITVVTPKTLGDCSLYTMQVEEMREWILVGVQA